MTFVQHGQVLDEELSSMAEMEQRLNTSGQYGLLRQLAGLGLDWKDALVLDTQPCLICLSRNDLTQTVRLSSIKQEARFTTTAHVSRSFVDCSLQVCVQKDSREK